MLEHPEHPPWLRQYLTLAHQFLIVLNDNLCRYKFFLVMADEGSEPQAAERDFLPLCPMEALNGYSC